MRSLRTWLLVPMVLTLSACVPTIHPTHVGNYDLVYAKSYFAAREDERVADRANLSLGQLYALYRYSRERMHHPPDIAGELIRRGEPTAQFLRPRLNALARSEPNLELFRIAEFSSMILCSESLAQAVTALSPGVVATPFSGD